MKVEPVPWGRLQFRVQSASRKRKWHNVDLEAKNLNGQCDCEDFRMRRNKMLREDYWKGRKHRCPHIIAALIYFADWNLIKIAERMKQNEKR